MHQIITDKLKNPKFSSQDEVNAFIREIKNDILEYEQTLYENDTYSIEEQKKIRKWRKDLYDISNKEKMYESNSEINTVLESTFNILNKQIDKVEENISLLEKGTIKLMGLNYTNDDIENELMKTKKKIHEIDDKERQEMNLIYVGFTVFMVTCVFCLVDKFFL